MKTICAIRTVWGLGRVATKMKCGKNRSSFMSPWVPNNSSDHKFPWCLMWTAWRFYKSLQSCSQSQTAGWAIRAILRSCVREQTTCRNLCNSKQSTTTRCRHGLHGETMFFQRNISCSEHIVNCVSWTGDVHDSYCILPVVPHKVVALV